MEVQEALPPAGVLGAPPLSLMPQHFPRETAKSVRKDLLRKAQVAEKAEGQEALPPAGVLGAEPLSLMPQHFPREPAKRCFRATAANQVFLTV